MQQLSFEACQQISGSGSKGFSKTEIRIFKYFGNLAIDVGCLCALAVIDMGEYAVLESARTSEVFFGSDVSLPDLRPELGGRDLGYFK